MRFIHGGNDFEAAAVARNKIESLLENFWPCNKKIEKLLSNLLNRIGIVRIGMDRIKINK